MTGTEGTVWLTAYKGLSAVRSLDLSPLGGTTIERSLAKDVIEIPVPNQDQIGIDIGFASGDQINLETMFGDGWNNSGTATSNAFNTLFTWTKYRRDVGEADSEAGKITDFKLYIGANVYYWVTIKNISASLTGGEGDRVPVRITFGIVQHT